MVDSLLAPGSIGRGQAHQMLDTVLKPAIILGSEKHCSHR